MSTVNKAMLKNAVGQAVATSNAQTGIVMDPVKLIAQDGSEIIVDRRAAMVSGTIKSMLMGPGNFSEQQQGEIKFPEMSARVLEKTVQYFYYKLRHTNSSGPLPEFKIEPEFALELLMAANFLDT